MTQVEKFLQDIYKKLQSYTFTNNSLNVNVTASVLPTGIATAANQTSGNQLTGIYDANTGEIATILSGGTPVNPGTDRALVVAVRDNITVSLISGGPETITSTVANSSGSVTSGGWSVSFLADSSFSGTVNGAVLISSTGINFTARENKTLPAINYTISAGTLRIDKIS